LKKRLLVLIIPGFVDVDFLLIISALGLGHFLSADCWCEVAVILTFTNLLTCTFTEAGKTAVGD